MKFSAPQHSRLVALHTHPTPSNFDYVLTPVIPNKYQRVPLKSTTYINIQDIHPPQKYVKLGMFTLIALGFLALF